MYNRDLKNNRLRLKIHSTYQWGNFPRAAYTERAALQVLDAFDNRIGGQFFGLDHKQIGLLGWFLILVVAGHLDEVVQHSRWRGLQIQLYEIGIGGGLAIGAQQGHAVLTVNANILKRSTYRMFK